MTHTKTEKQNNQLSDLEKTDHNKKTATHLYSSSIILIENITVPFLCRSLGLKEGQFFFKLFHFKQGSHSNPLSIAMISY